MTMDLIRGVRFAIVTMVLFGGAYPFAVWGLAQTAFRHQAQGSLVTRADGSIIGSSLIAQAFEGDAYVHPRPSGVDYNAASTGGTNFGPTNPDHLKAVRERVAAARKREAVPSGVLPADLVTASGAGWIRTSRRRPSTCKWPGSPGLRWPSTRYGRSSPRTPTSHAGRPRTRPRQRTAAEPGAGCGVPAPRREPDRTRPMTDRARQVSMWEGAIVRQATVDAFTKLDPRVQVRNPVMCLVTVGSLLTTMVFVQDIVERHRSRAVHRSGRTLALVHGALCQFRRGDGRGARQGAGQHAAQDTHRDRGAPARCIGARRGRRGREPAQRRSGPRLCR